MAAFLADIHSFIIYSFIGTALILTLAYLLFKIMDITSPRLRAYAYFSALIVPGLTYIVLHVIINKACRLGYTLPINLGNITEVYNAVCRIGAKVSDFLVPFFGAAFVVGTLKGIVSILACRRLIRKYGYLKQAEAPYLFEILESIANQAGIATPQLIVTPSEKVKAFTFGIKQPVIVISEGVLKALSEDDLKHVLKHECAHIQRNDIIGNWLAVITRDISFFNPLAQLAFTLYVQAKEEASDDLAIRTGVNPYEYGSTLIKMWRISKENTFVGLIYDNLSPNPGFLKKAASFEKRVSRMLSWKENTSESRYFKTALSLVIVFSLMILALIC